METGATDTGQRLILTLPSGAQVMTEGVKDVDDHHYGELLIEWDPPLTPARARFHRRLITVGPTGRYGIVRAVHYVLSKK